MASPSGTFLTSVSSKPRAWSQAKPQNRTNAEHLTHLCLQLLPPPLAGLCKQCIRRLTLWELHSTARKERPEGLCSKDWPKMLRRLYIGAFVAPIILQLILQRAFTNDRRPEQRHFIFFRDRCRHGTRLSWSLRCPRQLLQKHMPYTCFSSTVQQIKGNVV